AATGDVLVHSPLAAAAHGGGYDYDFDPMFEDVRPILEAADLAICHLETTLSRDNRQLSYYPIFEVPRQVGAALARAGYDYCSTASNHSVDVGLRGVGATLDVLDRVGLAHDGTARSRSEARAPAYLTVEGVRIALLSYTYGLNGLPPPEGAAWAVNLIDGRRIVADARRARRRGARFVIVSVHWGAEYVQSPTPDQRRIARRIVRSGAVDVVIGHHAHVVQPIDRAGGPVVVYGLGNFLSSQSGACCPVETQDGVIVHLRVEGIGGDFRVTRILYTPTWVSHEPYRILPVALARRDPTTPEYLKDEVQASFERTRAAIEALEPRGIRASARGFSR
ncbi:MAG: CapA family protein, partial [Actinomycetota bacterium]|nr:CapA family protein [Actinomycetota bacterium]